jgi:hypothetical protein
LINNRQGGRRRGRGGGQRSPNNMPSGGNRQDNRQRGNAAQLHEKYKALARDAQLSGDRVQTEFYLQFADHYFRVLNEGRARFEEQRRQRDDFSNDDEDYQDEAANAAGAESGDERESRSEEESDYRNGRDRQGRGNGRERERDRPAYEPREESFEQPVAVEADEERISLDVLPPAIAADAGGEPPRAPRRRPRRPRPDEGETEIAPAA